MLTREENETLTQVGRGKPEAAQFADGETKRKVRVAGERRK